MKESFRFNSTVLRGVNEMRPRWKRCLAFTDQALGEVLGQAYVRKNFTPEAKARALEMVRNIRAELKSRLGGLAWMSQRDQDQGVCQARNHHQQDRVPRYLAGLLQARGPARSVCDQPAPGQ